MYFPYESMVIGYRDHFYCSNNLILPNTSYTLQVTARIIIDNLYTSALYYPMFAKWLDKVIFNINTQTRTIILTKVSSTIAGVAVIKHTPIKNKICTFWINPIFQRHRIGEKLLSMCFNYMSKKLILITVPDFAISSMSPFLQRFGFRQAGYETGKYQPGRTEYFFISSPRSTPLINAYFLLPSVRRNFVEDVCL